MLMIADDAVAVRFGSRLLGRAAGFAYCHNKPGPGTASPAMLAGQVIRSIPSERIRGLGEAQLSSQPSP